METERLIKQEVSHESVEKDSDESEPDWSENSDPGMDKDVLKEEEMARKTRPNKLGTFFKPS